MRKLIPRLEDLAVLWPVLATSGTGQGITTYSTLIGGPRRPGEADGPEEFHVVLVDNGRSRLLADAEQREVLHCIRCGACLNICPVFRTCWRPHLRHDVSGADRQRAYAAPEWDQGVQASFLRVVAVRRLHAAFVR